MSKKQTIELIGLNNGRTICTARKQTDGIWLCLLGHDDTIVAKTMGEAERVLRDIGCAMKILRCPKLAD